MKLKNNRAYKGISLALMTILLHLSVGATMAAPTQVIAKLLTTGGTIKVNDNDSPSGSSIVSGAVIETPDNIAATIQIGDLGILELPPGSLAVLEYSGNNIKVTLRRGCAILETNKNTTGSIVNTDGKLLQTNSNAEEGMPGDANYRRMSRAANSDGTMRRRLPVCGLVPAGPGMTTLPGVIGAAGAGGAAAAGLSGGAIAAIIAGVAGGAVVVGIIGTRGGDSSPSRP
jgi:hypothetical protein